MIVISAEVVTTKLLFGMCDCTVDNHDGMGNLPIMVGTFA